MKTKTLATAMVVIAPVFLAIGCGSSGETRTLVAEQAIQGVQAVQAVMPEAEELKVIDDVNDQAEEVNTDSQIIASANELEQQMLSSDANETMTEMLDTNPPEKTQFYFSSDDSRVKQEDFEAVIAHAEYLTKYPQKRLRLIGFTDKSGDAEYNRWLSRQRAEAVASILVNYGVSTEQIVVEAMGEEMSTEGLEHVIADRRVELKYTSEAQLSEASSF